MVAGAEIGARGQGPGKQGTGGRGEGQLSRDYGMGARDGVAGKKRRKCLLSREKRRMIVAMLSNGSSRRMAARYIGCAPSTITRLAARDPQFARQLDQAEQGAEIQALRCLRNAAADPRYWRAAAWLLERKNPDDFARRLPESLTGPEIFTTLTHLMLVMTEGLDEKQCDHFLRRLEELRNELEETGALRRAAPVSDGSQGKVPPLLPPP
jgi:hypothetical protein